MARVLLGLGSNLGERDRILRSALDALARRNDCRLLAASALGRTAPAGGPASQPDYLNACATIETNLPPEALWCCLSQLEQHSGRVRVERWGPRTLDLDLLLYDELIYHSTTLELPHPRMSFRRFVLEPAADIAASWRHPTSGCTVGELLAHLNSTPNYLALGGGAPRLRESLAQRLAGPLRTRDTHTAATAPRSTQAESTVRWCRGGDESAGSTGVIPLESVRRLADRVRRDLADLSNSNDWLVSDFWLNELLAGAGANRRTAASNSESGRMESPLPVAKLVVQLEPLTVPGPSLRLNPDDLAHCVAEVLGAIEAMQ